MTARHSLEQGLRDWLRANEAMPDYLGEVFRVTVGTPQRQPSIAARLVGRLEQRYPVANRRLVTIALVGLLVVSLLGALLLIAGKVPIVDPSMPTPPPTDQRSLPATSAPDASLPTASPHAFDPRKDPFPAPLRLEPLSGAPVVEAFTRPDLEPGAGAALAWFDPRGDGAPEVDARVDLVTVDFSAGSMGRHAIWASYETAQLLDPPLPDPETEWIAYGMVIDIDADGQPDQRFGIDNIAGGSSGRAWLTIFESGATVIQSPAPSLGDSNFPYSTGTTPDQWPNRGYMRVNAPLITPLGEPGGRFYLWSALVRDGRVVSLDFAPDTGWLQTLPPAN